MKITLVRHTSVDVPAGVCYGFTDVPLKESFPDEAAAVKENLEAAVSAGGRFDAVFCSPLSRCRRLAAYCGYPSEQGACVADPRLKEMNFGEFEMMTFDDIAKDPRSKSFYEDYVNNRVPGGECLKDQLHRVSEFLSDLKSGRLAPGAENVLLFTHGGVLICAQIVAGVIRREEAFEKLTPYGGIVTITI